MLDVQSSHYRMPYHGCHAVSCVPYAGHAGHHHHHYVLGHASFRRSRPSRRGTARGLMPVARLPTTLTQHGRARLHGSSTRRSPFSPRPSPRAWPRAPAVCRSEETPQTLSVRLSRCLGISLHYTPEHLSTMKCPLGDLPHLLTYLVTCLQLG